MFSLMIQKLRNKKWIVMCVLAGNILLIAVAVSHSLYRASAFQRMMTEEFAQYQEDTGNWPASFQVEQNFLRQISQMTFGDTDAAVWEFVADMGIPVQESVIWFATKTVQGEAKDIRDGKKSKTMQLAAASDWEEHIEITQGTMPGQQITEDGFVEVAVSETVMVYMDLLIGDEFTIDTIEDKNQNPLKIRVTGMYQFKEDSQLYQMTPVSKGFSQVFMQENIFRQLFTSGSVANQSLQTGWYVFWDYTQMEAEKIADYLNTYRNAAETGILSDKVDASVFQNNITQYSARVKQIGVTLMILQIPVLLLVSAFLYMISGQMLGMEQNEISLMKSRGANKRQIVGLYLLQSVFLSGLSFVPGLLLGIGICSFMNGATAFLEFSGNFGMQTGLSAEVFLYGAAAALLSVAMTTIPVIRYSGVSIVHVKQNRSKKKKSLWKKMYLDGICLAVSLYGYFSYRRNEQAIVQNVLKGENLDPMLYISFSVFILGCGLLLCRLQPYLMKLFYRLFGKRLKPAAYASMLEAIRTSYKQEFIILFLILTVAIGISDTTLSRTVLANAEENIGYVLGTDVVMQEKWKNNYQAVLMGLTDKLEFYEPDYSKYGQITGVEEMTKVFRKTMRFPKNQDIKNVDMIAVSTKGFAEVTQMQEGMLPYHYYDYLNVLASDYQGFLVSENFMTNFGYKLGDKIELVDAIEGYSQFPVTGYIRGFFNYWPGYNPVIYQANEDGITECQDNYMIVGNYASVMDQTLFQPYQIWMKVNDEGEGVNQWMKDNPDVIFERADIVTELMQEKKEDTLVQGTNGILSMSFLIILLLCCVGYLIYWIMSIRSRELLFGVLRAMGMQKKEIMWMLAIEQICSGFFAIVAGGGIGVLASRLFVPMIQSTYAATDQVLPLKLITQASDVIQLYLVILAVLGICLMILGKLISRMNISNALKLGED